MAGTAGSGGLGALAIGGIAAAAVVIGGVVLVQFGVFNSEPPVVDPVATAQQAAPKAGTPDVAAVSEPANTNAPTVTNAPTGDQNQSNSGSLADDSEVQIAATSTPAVADSADPSAEAQDVAQERALAKTIERTDAIADSTETEVSAEAVAPQENPEDIVTAALAQPEIAAPEKSEEETFVLTAPELDLVRFDADGAGLIAGRAQVGVLVSVLLDGKVLDQFEVQNGGEFVSFSSIDPSAEARVVSLQAAFNGQLVMSDATFILAPSAAVAVVATAGEPPSEQEVAQVDVTPEVQGGSVAPEEVTGAAAPAVAAPDVTAKASAAVAVAEASSLSEDPAAEPTAAVTDQPVEVAQAADKPVSAVETAAVIPQPVSPPVSPPVTETVAEPKPKPSPVLMAILKADADGVELVQPTSPIAPELVGKVSLDIISYSDEGDVQLAGRAGSLSRVRVYLDNNPVAGFQAAEDGRWKGQLRDVEPGIYTLRLDELDGTGKVLSRLETPFKRETPEALQSAAVAEASPAQAAPPIRAVTVQKGDTLWAISRERYGDGLLYVRVFEANQDAIRDPDLIYPGQIFSIPE